MEPPLLFRLRRQVLLLVVRVSRRQALRAILPVITGVRRPIRPVAHPVGVAAAALVGLAALLATRPRPRVRRPNLGRLAALAGAVTQTILRIPTLLMIHRRPRLRGVAAGRKQSLSFRLCRSLLPPCSLGRRPSEIA